MKDMNIYTKTGDKGSTSLVGGARVRKDDPKVNAYGNVDELISNIALIRAEEEGVPLAENLRRIQANLMLVAAHLAADDHGAKRLKSFDQSETEFLEKQIDFMTGQMPEQIAFILPAGPRAAALSHIARTVCRRAERSCVPLMEEPRIESVVKYLNRLSDYLFVFGRYTAHKGGVKDDFWQL